MRNQFPLPMAATLAAVLFSVLTVPASAAPDNLPKVEFDEASLDEIINFFREGGGVGEKRNILVDPRIDREVTVTLRLRNVPLGVAFAYAAELAGFDFREDQHAIRIVPLRGKPAPVPAFLKRGGAMTSRRASQIQLPKVEFDQTELRDVIDDLTAASRRLDPRKEGLNIIMGRGVDPGTPISLSLQSVPLSTALAYVAQMARLDLRADGHALVLTTRPKSAPQAD